MSPGIAERNNYIETLYAMLNDTDASVVSNVIVTLDEILMEKGGIAINQATIMQLLNRISEFNEWGLNSILELVTRYTPITEDETFAIMNLLDPVLRTGEFVFF